MYLRDLAASLLRRWYLVIAAVLLSVAAGYGAAHVVGPTYSASGGLVLLPPSDPENPDANRFLALGGLKQAGDVLIRSLTNDATAHAIRDEVSAGEYAVAPDYTTSAPVVVVTASAPDPKTADALLQAVVKQVPVNLKTMQQDLNIAEKNQIVIEVVDSDDKPSFVLKPQLRAGVAGGVIVLGLLAVLIGAFDGIVMRRRTKIGAIHAVRSPDIPGAPEKATPLKKSARPSTDHPKARTQ